MDQQAPTEPEQVQRRDNAASNPRARSVNAPPRRRPSKKIAFGWYGGKFSHLNWLLPLLPTCHHYCEPFAGSAAVLLNRAPSSVETYNDIDGDVVNFFRVLRDHGEELIRVCALTPFAREEYRLALGDQPAGITVIERARRFFVRARQTRTGLAQTASIGRWANCKATSRSGMSGVVSRWQGGVAGLSAVAERLLRVQIEHRPALDIIRIYDSPATLFYCDPPYVHTTRTDTRTYGFEMDDAQHTELAAVLHAVTGRVAISGYRCDLMDTLYGDWRRHDAPVKTIHSAKSRRQESLWMNHDAHATPCPERP